MGDRKQTYMNQKIVLYTAVFGDSYGIIPQEKIEGVDFVCFTDTIKKVPKPWKAVAFKNDKINDHLKNRHVKLLPHLYFKDYDISIYIDSNFLIIGDVHQLVLQLNDFKMATFCHTQSDDARNCIYDEYEAILNLAQKTGKYKDDPVIIKNQIDAFKQEGYPENNGLIKGGVLIRKHNDTAIIQLMTDWWNIVATQSKRDQLSFNYVAWKYNFKPTIIPGDIRFGNPYFYFLATARKSYSTRILKYRVKKCLGMIKHPAV